MNPTQVLSRLAPFLIPLALLDPVIRFILDLLTQQFPLPIQTHLIWGGIIGILLAIPIMVGSVWWVSSIPSDEPLIMAGNILKRSTRLVWIMSLVLTIIAIYALISSKWLGSSLDLTS